jgi:CubicO group peptidase (beta-lactamase class C family)
MPWETQSSMPARPTRRAILVGAALAPRLLARPSELDAALEAMVASGRIVGAQATVVNGGLVLDKAYGRVAPGAAGPANLDTLFCVGSVSKPLASTIALQLADEGVIDLEAPVSSHLPEMAEPRLENGERTRPPTLRELLAHRGGIYTQRRRLTASQHRWIRDHRLTLAEAVAGIAAEPLVARPGEEFHYSGAGYCLLGRALELATGETMEKLLQERIARRAGWRRGTYFPRPGDENVAAGSSAVNPAEADAETPHLLGTEHRLALVGGSVYATAAELAAFGRLVVAGGGNLLSESAWAEALRQPFPGQAYGHGWSLGFDDAAGGKAVALSHNGALAASRAVLRVDLRTGGVAAVVYTLGVREEGTEARVGEAARRALE